MLKGMLKFINIFYVCKICLYNFKRNKERKEYKRVIINDFLIIFSDEISENYRC